MKQVQVHRLLFLSACLFAVVSAQEFPGMKVCTQQPEGPDPGDDNYGDFSCWFYDDGSMLDKDSIAREVIFDKTENSTGVMATMDFEGYEIGYVWVLNFGRQRGFTSLINWVNVWETGTATLQVQVDHDQGRDSRLFLEVYGVEIFRSNDAPRSITAKMEPIFNKN